MKRIIGLSAFLVIAAISIAEAAEPGWTGFYIGVNGGYTWGHTDLNLTTPSTNPYLPALDQAAVEASGSSTSGNSSQLFGGQVGYLAQVDRVLVGVEAGLDWMHVSGSTVGGAHYATLFCNQTNCSYALSDSARTDWLVTLLARVGPNLGSWFPYVTGGLAVARIGYSVAFSDNDAMIDATTAGSFSRTQNAPAVGGGLEWRWNDHWSLRGEYLYIPFSGLGGTTPPLSTDVGSPPDTSFSISERFKENIARAALSYKF